MNNYHKELLLEIINEWDDDQLNGYIFLQEQRLEDTRRMVRDLKEIQRKRRKKIVVETGARDGR